MPSSPRPKEFVAAANFQYAGRSYRVGDPVTDPRTIGFLVTRGSRFLTTVKPPKTAPADPPADRSAVTTQPAESTEED